MDPLSREIEYDKDQLEWIYWRMLFLDESDPFFDYNRYLLEFEVDNVYMDITWLDWEMDSARMEYDRASSDCANASSRAANLQNQVSLDQTLKKSS